MRTYFLSAALAFALALPDPALAQSGHVDLSYTNHEYDFGGFGTDVDGASLGGQVAFDAGPVGVQIDARYAQWETDVNDLDVFGLGAHVFTRNDRWLFGGYVGYDEAEQWNYETWTGALETQFYMPRATISGVLSYSEFDIVDYSVTMLEGQYRHFVTDNFSIHGGLGFGQGDIGAADPDAWSGEVGAEYQFARAPLSVFGSYRHNTLDFSTGEIDVDTLSIGLRYIWGGTLMDRNRSGAGLNRVTPLFERFVS